MTTVPIMVSIAPTVSASQAGIRGYKLGPARPLNHSRGAKNPVSPRPAQNKANLCRRQCTRGLPVTFVRRSLCHIFTETYHMMYAAVKARGNLIFHRPVGHEDLLAVYRGRDFIWSRGDRAGGAVWSLLKPITLRNIAFICYTKTHNWIWVLIQGTGALHRQPYRPEGSSYQDDGWPVLWASLGGTG